MFSFSNSTPSQSYSIKPKKDTNNDYVNISNDISNVNNNILTVDVKAINFENISVELALNILQLKHNIYYEMSQYEVIEYFNNKMKLTNNINNILALKIILKAKLKGLDVKINKNNVMTFSDTNNKNNNQTQENNKIFRNYDESKEKVMSGNKMYNGDEHNIKNFKIQQIQNENFKLVQNNSVFNKSSYGSNPNQNHANHNQVNYNQANYNQVNHNQVNHNQVNHNQVNYNQFNHNQNNFKANQQAYGMKQNIDKIDKIKNNPDLIIVQNNKQSIQSNHHAQTQQNQNISNLKSYPNPNKTVKSVETFNGYPVVNSSEFDIDSIINSYTQKKNLGIVK
jgi:hypothetical protein